MNPAIAVQEYGQSLWLDYIHRQELRDGTLQRRIAEEGILGVTSNPSIFQKSIGESAVYDEDMLDMLDLDAEAIYEKLAVEDIQAAADLFAPVYERTGGRDGYVSLEVSPLLANNSEDTVAEAKRLFELVDRPNVMIKIPGTQAGIPAIEEAIASGINVNVTLLFSVQNYEEVAMAYISGLERRLQAGEPIDMVASVASFFLSRIDTSVDRILENNMRVAQVLGDTARIAANRRLLGQAAIANAKLAYRTFQRIFGSARFKELRQQGAAVQRPLWASTSNKNPAYEDTRYVDLLIGRDTVNTVPPNTLKAFIDHGTVNETIVRDLDEYMPPQEVISKLAELGIDIEQITERLQVDGVDAFITSFETLIEQVEAKLTVLRSGVMDRQKLALGIYGATFNKAIHNIERDFVNARIWSKDGSLWKNHGPTIQKIQKRLGWLDVLETIDIERLKQLQQRIKEADMQDVVLLGMGGSSLAPDVLYRTFGKQEDFPSFTVLDSTDPERILEVEAQIDISKTLFVVSSKSGTTIETMSLFAYFWQQSGENGAQFIAITDPETELAQLAEERNFSEIFLNPADIGGRYSALSYFGMAPAALMGLDLDELWNQARLMIEASHENIPGHYHPGISLGVYIGALAKEGRDKLSVYATQSLVHFGDWAEQLIAESLGKAGKGVIPVVGEEIDSPQYYVTDRLFVFLREMDDPDSEEMRERVGTLREAGHPRATLRVPGKYAIAGEFFRWEFATAIAAYLLELNPFDEPNVAEAKQATQEMLDYQQTHGELPSAAPLVGGTTVKLYSDEKTVAPLREMCRSHGYDPTSRTEVLAAQIAGTHAGDYFALLCYFTPNETVYRMLHEVRTRLRNVTKRAVTVGFGPRYLHSTGQLHKGGSDNAVFFQLTTTIETDLEIPGKPYTFGTLYRAQADGDLQTLQKHGRRAIRLDIESDLEDGLQKLMDAIQFVEERRFR